MMIELRGYKGFRTDDGTAFTATLWVGGKKVGTVQQLGHGGSNTYHFVTKEAQAACVAEAKAWMLARGVDPEERYSEPLDEYVDSLLDEMEIIKKAKQFSKRSGMPVVLLLQKGIADWSRDRGPAFYIYEKEYLMGVLTEDRVASVVEREKPDAWRIVLKPSTEAS